METWTKTCGPLVANLTHTLVLSGTKAYAWVNFRFFCLEPGSVALLSSSFSGARQALDIHLGPATTSSTTTAWNSGGGIVPGR